MRMDGSEMGDHAWHGLLRRAWILEWIPFLDFALVGGSLAAGGAHAGSDWDIIAGTRRGRLYTARFFCLVIFRLLRLRVGQMKRYGFCFNNFVGGGTALLPAKSAYARAMHAGLVPLVGEPRMIREFLVRSGAWREGAFADRRYRYRQPKIGAVRFVERLLEGAVGTMLERALRSWQMKRVEKQRMRFGAGNDSRIVMEEERAELCFKLKGEIDRTEKPAIMVATMATIQPISDRIFLEAIEEPRVTKSGIVLADTSEKERPVKGRIVAAGPGKRTEKGDMIPLSVKVGDIVLFKKYGPDEVEVDGKKYLVTEESEILAIIKE